MERVEKASKRKMEQNERKLPSLEAKEIAYISASRTYCLVLSSVIL